MLTSLKLEIAPPWPVPVPAPPPALLPFMVTPSRPMSESGLPLKKESTPPPSPPLAPAPPPAVLSEIVPPVTVRAGGAL